MAQNPNNIVAVAAVIRPEQGDPYCVVRWTLGAQGSELPHLDDVFDVSLTVGGILVAQTAVSPMGYAMLDPSRRAAPDLYPNEPSPWWVAVKPTGPIVPADADAEDLTGKAVGVAHLLGPTATPRLRYRAARVLMGAFITARAEEPRLSTLADQDLVRSAVTLADVLISSRIRPRHLPQLAAREMRQIHAGQGEPLLLQSGRGGLAQAAHVALVLRALAVPGVSVRLDEVVEQSRSVREHIRVAGLQGGSMIDYWDDPTNSGAAHSDAARGKLWPAAELIGCGCRIPIQLDDLQKWARGNDPLLVTVAHRTRPIAPTDLRAISGDRLRGAREIWLETDRANWGSVTSEELVPGRLLLALSNARSSHPSSPPKAARVDWGMVRIKLQEIVDTQTQTTVPTNASLSFRTGDAKIEIAIDKPPLPRLLQRQSALDQMDEARTGASYNIYGVWEGAPGFQQYFDDPSANPDLATLRPWLITRRYGFAKDLKDAFPNIGGHQHPNLQAMIDNPPWHPLLKRPNRLQSENDPHITTALPDVGAAGDAVFAFDLRTGMALPPQARPPKGWEPGAPMALGWRPELDRELSAVTNGRPQRYRFWVTAVDAFEQESEPRAVATQDDDLGEAPTTIFEPRRRSPLGAAPGGDALTCVFTEADNKRQLTVSFETPFQRQVSDQSGSGAPTARVDASTIEAQVVVFRRLLLADVSTTQRIRRQAATIVPTLPQWQTLVSELAVARWTPWRADRITTPTTGDQWTKTLSLDEDDLGWEYLGAVGFEVKASHRPFWAKAIVAEAAGGRRLTVVTPKEDGSYPAPADQEVRRITETPADSQIATTQPIMVSDRKAPWWPEVTDFKVVRATAVPAPPSVRRDLILQRLLERDFIQSGRPVDKVSWGGEMLTIGQLRSSAAALERTRASDISLPSVDSDAMAPARRILARDFSTEKEGRLRQHASIGFRGLACLEWIYKPRSHQTSTIKRAEAAAFRVYAAMAPTDKDLDSKNFATLIGRISRIGSSGQTYSLTFTEGDDDAWATVSARPTLVAVGPGARVQWASVIKAERSGGAYRVELMRDGSDSLPPGPIEARFFAAQPLDDIPSGGVDDVSRHTFYAPIPGGEGACFAWWVTGVSAAGKESPRDFISPMHLMRLPRTVEPPPVYALAVRPAAKPGDALNPQQHRAWLPSAIQTTADAGHYPRNVVTWRAPEEDLFLEIRRVERQVAKPTAPALVDDFSAWDAIQTIENLEDGAPIEQKALDSLAAWLGGTSVHTPDTPTDHWIPFQAGSNLKAQGVIQLDETQLFSPQALTADTQPAWVDYYGRNHDQASAMDGNWEYGYQLLTYLDLGVSAGGQRWLYSTATPWSPFVRPDRPPIRVYSGTAPIARPTQAAKARVVFNLIALLTSRLRAEARLVDDMHWEYRVVVRRQLPSAGISDNAPPWIDIGQPVSLLIGDQASTGAQVVDDEVDRSWPGHEPDLVYRVFVQEFMETPTGERLVRAYETGKIDDIHISLTAPASEAQEIEISKTVEIS